MFWYGFFNCSTTNRKVNCRLQLWLNSSKALLGELLYIWFILRTYVCIFAFLQLVIYCWRRARGREFIDLFDTLAYVIANESDLDFQLFCRIFVSKGVSYYVSWYLY